MPTRRDQLQPARPVADWRTRDVLAELGGAESLIEALELTTHGEPPDQMPSKERQLLDMLCDPAFANSSLPTLMKKAGLLLPDVLDVLRRRDVALAVARSGQRMGEVLDGVGEMAVARWAICDRCKGEGEIADDRMLSSLSPGEPIPMRDCPAACSDGKVLKDPNLEAVQIYLGVHGMGKQARGAGAQVINVNAQAQAGARASAGGDDSKKPPAQETVTDRVQAYLESGGVST